MNRLQERYENEVVKSLMEKFNYSSKMQAPKIEKIVLNIGVGDAVSNSKLLDDAVNELTLITGQKPVVTRAKKSIAGFKLREGQAIGCKVTLRGERMYEFLDKLVNVSLPRVRDFTNLSKNSYILSPRKVTLQPIARRVSAIIRLKTAEVKRNCITSVKKLKMKLGKSAKEEKSAERIKNFSCNLTQSVVISYMAFLEKYIWIRKR